MIIAIIFLLVICIVLCIQLAKKKQEDKEIEEKNVQLHQENSRLEQLREILDNKISDRYQEKERLDNEINQQMNTLNNAIETNKEVSDTALKNYIEVLNNKYNEIENEFDSARDALLVQLDEVREELNNLQATRAAAHQALLKEQEVKNNKDDYRLLPSDSDLADARRLEIVKRELNKPRIVCMLIWQTYWQPLAKKQFPLILQSKTKTGIYKITNIITDECYIGQAVDVYKRWCEHCKCGLGIDTPPGNKLYKAIQEYGLENFTFELIEECSSSELNEKEKYFIELYQADIYGLNGQKGNSR